MAPTLNCSMPGKVERTKVKIFDLWRALKNANMWCKYGRDCLNVKRKKSRETKREGLCPTKEMAKNRPALSRKWKSSSKQQLKSCSDLGNCKTGWVLRSIGRCHPWKLLFALHILLLTSCYIRSAGGLISPGSGFGGSLPLQHPSAAPLRGSERRQVEERWFELMRVDTVLFQPPALLPGTKKKGCTELLSWNVPWYFRQHPAPHTAEAFGLVEEQS